MTKMLMTQKMQKINYLQCTLEKCTTKHRQSKCKYCLRRVIVTWMWLSLKSFLKNSGHPDKICEFIILLLYCIQKKIQKIGSCLWSDCFESVCYLIKGTNIHWLFLCFHRIILNFKILFFKIHFTCSTHGQYFPFVGEHHLASLFHFGLKLLLPPL